MRAIIPVAGVGTRLRPHTYTLPKVLLNVAGKPILGHILDTLIQEGIRSATIVVGYMGELVEEYVNSHYNIDVEFVQQPVREGLGHSIYLAHEALQREALQNEPVLIILGDTIFEVELASVLKGTYSSLGVRHVDDPRRFGVVETDGGFATRLVEKPEVPTSNLAIVGIYFIRNARLLAECLQELVQADRRTRGEYQLTDALQMMIDRGERFTTFDVEGWFDCGESETLLATNRHLLEQKPPPRAIEGVVINPPVHIADDAVITNAIIGPHVTIAEGATIRDAVIIDSIVNAGASVSGVMLCESIIGGDASVIGGFDRINVGPGSELDLG